MAKKYDEIDKNAFCERYERQNNTGSDGKTDRGKWEPEAIEIFKSWKNFRDYHAKKQYGESLEQNPIQLTLEFAEDQNSELLNIIKSITDKQIKSNSRIVKSKLEELKVAGFPFENLDYDIKPALKRNANEDRSLFYATRRYAKDHF